VPDLFRCRCSCLNPILCNVPLGDGSFAMARYRFVPSCLTKYVNFESTDYTPAWAGAVHDPVDDTIPFFFCDDTVPGTATMTASGRDVGDVEIQVFDEDGILIARFHNDVYWQPNCGTQFVLDYYKPSCGEVWDQFPCLQPIAEPCTNCLCNGDKMTFTVDWSGLETAYDGPLGIGAIADNRITLECVDAPDVIFGASMPGNCFWEKEVIVGNFDDDCPGGYYRLIYLVTRTNAGAINARVHYENLCDSSDETLAISATNTGPDSDWCDAGPWALDDIFNPFFDITVTVTAVPTPDGNNRPDIRFDCEPANEPANCVGESLWTLRAWTLGALYLFYWEPDSDTCAGPNCNNAKSCEPAPPFDVPTYLIDEGQATALEILDLLNEQIAGTCGCVDPYVPPEEPNYCTGTSTWTLRRTLCEFFPVPGDHYLYYWDPGNSTCDGLCSDPSTCNGQPPYALSTSPLNDTDAGNLGYLDALDEEDTGGTCDCDDAYVPPSCPECEDCDDVTGDKEFLLSGFSGGEAMYNGTYTLQKGFFDCAFVECCWYGSDNDFEINAQLTWSGGVWTLSIDGGVAIYEVADDVCNNPIILNKTTGGASWPATLTVSE
jgi:hypothetical protein